MARKATSDTERIIRWFRNATPPERKLMRDVIAGICDDAEPPKDRKTRSDKGTSRTAEKVATA